MTRVIFDPEAMKAFAANLRSTRETLRDQQIALEAAAASLSEVWRDRRYQHFDSMLKNAMRTIDAYYRESEAHERYLIAKARRGREYLDGH